MTDRFTLRSYGGEIAMHRHDHTQIVLPGQGRLELEIGGRGGVVETGRGALIPAGTDHSFAAHADRQGNCFLVLDLGADPSGEQLIRAAGQPFFTVPGGLGSLLEYLRQRLRQGPPLDDSGHAAGCHLLADGLGLEVRPTGGPSPIIGRARAFMAAHLDQPLTIAAIAKAAGTSESRLHRLFRAERGESPHDHLTGLRLDRAVELLTTSREPIAAIALMTGFGDQSALTRRLRQRRGITPARLRRLPPADQR